MESGAAGSISKPEAPENNNAITVGKPLWDWAGRGTSHVAFGKDETLPLLQGRFLGYGVHGGVYETICNGNALAWKKKFYRYKVGPRELQEIEIIRRLNHQHIIKLVGTYTHGPFLGLLLWPVAVCDLGTFLDDFDIVQKKVVSNSPEPESQDENAVLQRLYALGFDSSSRPLGVVCQEVVVRLEQSLGCLASAMVYLHAQRIRHKDLKPSNILMSHNGIWVSDFGTSSDFSTQSESASQGGDRGTPKYFAPEVAHYEPNGRSADNFSLGCIFLEMIGLCVGYSLEELKELRPEKDCSFQANLDCMFQWFNRGRISSRGAVDDHLWGVVRMMLNANPDHRPTAVQIEGSLELIGGFRSSPSSAPFRGACCTPLFTSESIPVAPAPELGGHLGNPWGTPVDVSIGNTYRRGPTAHQWTFFVRPSFINMTEQLRVFLHCSSGKPQKIITSPIGPQYEFHGQGWGSFEISVYLVLKSGYCWESYDARPVPGEKQKRMLPLFWELDFENPLSEISRTVIVRSVTPLGDASYSNG